VCLANRTLLAMGIFDFGLACLATFLLGLQWASTGQPAVP